MKQITSKEIITPELSQDAILNEEHTGFKEDYLVLHCLMRKCMPATVLEVGTNMGTGTKIIKNAVKDGKVFSLDLPTELIHLSMQHPVNEGKGDNVGRNCDLPFSQLRSDSLTFDYSSCPCEAYYIDGEHDYEHPHHESKGAISQNPKMIVWHDSDIPEVYKAIVDAFEGNDNYDLFRVTDTRIAYAIRK